MLPPCQIEESADRWVVRGAKGETITILIEEVVADLTHDLGIPVFAGVTRRLSGPTEDIVVGFGSHVDRSLAVSRALAEMNQFLPAVLNVGADGVTQYGYGDPDTVRWWREARVETQSYVLPAGEVAVTMGALPSVMKENESSSDM